MKKRMILWMTAVVCTLSLIGCGGVHSDVEAPESGEQDVAETVESGEQDVAETVESGGQDVAETAESGEQDVVLVEERGRKYLVLPVSGKKIFVPGDCTAYVGRINADLLRAAEEKIGERRNAEFYIGRDQEGNLLLCAEVIVDLTPVYESGEDFMGGGCGIDHEHIFFSERITE